MLSSLVTLAIALGFAWLCHRWRRGAAEYISPWNAVIADHHASATERLLLGAAATAKRETAADRARKREEAGA